MSSKFRLASTVSYIFYMILLINIRELCLFYTFFGASKSFEFLTRLEILFFILIIYNFLYYYFWLLSLIQCVVDIFDFIKSYL